MTAPPRNGERRKIHGKPCVFYDGYWIRWYDPPPETLASKKLLIDQMARRLFHHAEPGLNTPGRRLEAARAAYQGERDPVKKRVKGAMLAGAFFNRGTDILGKIVDLQEIGVEIEPDHDLMKECERCLMEAMELGKLVRERNSKEGLDELWGEPLRAFSLSIDAFCRGRYIKIAHAMRSIDEIADRLTCIFRGHRAFHGLDVRIRQLAEAAKLETETQRTDDAIFEVWPAFVAEVEMLSDFDPDTPEDIPQAERQRVKECLRIVQEGVELITKLGYLRVPLPARARKFLKSCDSYVR